MSTSNLNRNLSHVLIFMFWVFYLLSFIKITRKALFNSYKTKLAITKAKTLAIQIAVRLFLSLISFRSPTLPKNEITMTNARII